MNMVINLRPLVSFASRHIGSGPSRLRMVRLWHELDGEPIGSSLRVPRS
jgi:hypothetical protein